MLVEKGEAYYCFCDKERLDNLTEEVVDGKSVRKYDKHCLHLSKEEVERRYKRLYLGEEDKYSCPLTTCVIPIR